MDEYESLPAPSYWLSTIPAIFLRISLYEAPATNFTAQAWRRSLRHAPPQSSLVCESFFPNKANDDQPVPTRPSEQPIEYQRIFLSHPTH
jgi:hypothetical protein